MNQKGFVHILVILVLIVLTGVLGYIAFENKEERSPTQNATTTSSEPSNSDAPSAKESGINGTVIKHYCNGVQPQDPTPDYQPCGEEPLASFTLDVTNNASGVTQKVTTDSKGTFHIELPPGTYTISHKREGGILGGSTVVTVSAGTWSAITLKFEEMRP
jgi:hypothetical protein